MHGGASTMLSMSSDAGTNSGIVNTAASYCSTNGWKKSQIVGVRLGEVDVAAPDPRGVRVVDGPPAREVAQRRRLRVVDDDEVPLAFELERVRQHPLEVGVLHRRGPLDVGALEPVVDRLRDLEELVAAPDHLPLGFDTDVAQQRARGSRAARRRRRRTRWRSRGARVRPASGRASSWMRSIVPGSTTVGVVVQALLEEGDPFEHEVDAFPRRA